MAAVMTSEPTETPIAATARRFLFVHWEGGGNTPPMLAVVRRLLARGHAVRVLSDPCNRDEVEAAGASFASWTRGRPRPDKSVASDPLKDWQVRSPLAMIARLRDRLFVGPALDHALDVRDELGRFAADVIVTSEMLLGAMAAAEHAGVPCVAISSNIYLFPLEGVPPFGPGFAPARGIAGRLRDALVERMTRAIFGRGTTRLNEARAELGLPPLSHPFEQASRVAKHLLLTSPAFDFPATTLPAHLVYAGPELEDPVWTEPWRSPWPPADRRPLVLVGFSTTFQDQANVLRRVVEALRGLPVRAVVTTGPSIDARGLPAAENVHVCRSAPHAALLREAAVVVTHAGHGTVIRALAAGVPLVCLPMGRDQHDNTARVVERGAGIRLGPKASARRIREAVEAVLRTPAYRERARDLGRRIAEDGRRSTAVETLERIAASR